MGAVFHSTLSQIGFLFLLIGIGWLLAKLNVLPKGASAVLAKLETVIFVPALVMSTFMQYFTPEVLSAASKTLLASSATLAGSIFLALIFARLCARDDYSRKLYTYGLAFSNFGFMGNAVISAVFPAIFLQYLIFTIPFWMLIYLWGVPSLLIPGSKKTIGDRLRALFNPMFVGMVIGIVFGLTGWQLPGFITSAVSVAGDCMSPIAMLLTGITVAGIGFKDSFGRLGVWAVSVIRLLLLPVIGILVLLFLPLGTTLEVCIVAVLAMPLGLNTIVIPASYGKNPAIGTSMAMLSHLLSCFTIPLVFWLMERIL
ncbi:MAG: AEC family transporter [Clostridia bacterium]|nr:AEC family transporter [Clostridia bacterium]